MKNLFLSLAVSLSVTSAARADIITCVFTEPYITSTYSMTQSTLTYENFDGSGKSVIKNVSFQIKSAGVFELIDKSGKVLQTLNLNGEGSDGASDRNYPYEVNDYTMDNSASSGNGGCTSNQLKATNP